MKTSWKSYEEVTKYFLGKFAHHFHLESVEGKQTIHGRTISWEVDAKGVREGNKGFVIIKCRRHTTAKHKQGKLATMAYHIVDTGALGRIIVSPLGIQTGVGKIARSANVISVQLDPNGAPTQFVMKFLKKLMIGIGEKVTTGDSVSLALCGTCQICCKQFLVIGNEQICPNCLAKSVS